MSHTALYRLGGVLTLAVPVLVALIVAIALTDGLTAVCAPTSTSPTLHDPHVSIARFDRLRRVGDHDEALVALDVDFDLSSCATWNAKTVFFIKRSLASGYAGVENELFFRDNTMMLFADAKVMCEGIVKALD